MKRGKTDPFYPPDIRSPNLCYAHVFPGLVAVDHRVCGARRAAPRRPGGRGGPPGLKATHAAWRRWWHVLQSGSATRSTSTLAHSNPSSSSRGSAMVRLGRRGLILTKPNRSSFVLQTSCPRPQGQTERRHLEKNMRQLSFRQPLPTSLPTPPSLSSSRTKGEGRGGVGSWMMTWSQAYHN